MRQVDEMTEGYMAGLRSESGTLPECYAERSAAFKHGWLNGRDDRLGVPRDRAQVLVRRADMIIGAAQ